MGLFGDMFTKSEPSRQEIFNEILNKTTMDILVSQTAQSSGVINAVQNIDQSGNSGIFAGNTNEQIASINISMLQDAQVNADMQQKMITALTNEIERQKTDFPEIASSADENIIRNTIKNEVESSFSQESIAQLQLAINATQNVRQNNNTGVFVFQDNTQKVDAVGKLVSTLSSNISSKFFSENTTNNTSKNTTTFFGSDLLKGMGDLLTGAGIFALLANPLTAIPLLIFIIMLAYFLLRKSPQPPMPNYGMQPQMMPQMQMMQPQMQMPNYGMQPQMQMMQPQMPNYGMQPQMQQRQPQPNYFQH